MITAGNLDPQHGRNQHAHEEVDKTDYTPLKVMWYLLFGICGAIAGQYGMNPKPPYESGVEGQSVSPSPEYYLLGIAVGLVAGYLLKWMGIAALRATPAQGNRPRP